MVRVSSKPRSKSAKRVYITLTDPRKRMSSRGMTVYGLSMDQVERMILKLDDKEQQRQAPVDPNVTPSDEMKAVAAATELSSPTLAGADQLSETDSPSTPDAPRSGERRVSTQPADGTAAPQGANGVAPLSPSRPSVSVSGNGSHAVERSPSSRERDKR